MVYPGPNVLPVLNRLWGRRVTHVEDSVTLGMPPLALHQRHNWISVPLTWAWITAIFLGSGMLAVFGVASKQCIKDCKVDTCFVVRCYLKSCAAECLCQLLCQGDNGSIGSTAARDPSTPTAPAASPYANFVALVPPPLPMPPPPRRRNIARALGNR